MVQNQADIIRRWNSTKEHVYNRLIIEVQFLVFLIYPEIHFVAIQPSKHDLQARIPAREVYALVVETVFLYLLHTLPCLNPR